MKFAVSKNLFGVASEAENGAVPGHKRMSRKRLEAVAWQQL